MAVLPPTTPTQRLELPEYTDLAEVLRQGFLTSDVKIGRVHISLRSILPWDREILNRRIALQESDQQFKIWLLAQLTWMVDGHVLLNRPDVEVELYRTYSKLSSAHINKIFGAFLQTRVRYYKAYEGLESFGFEYQSRTLWAESKIVGVASAAFRGYSAPLGLCEIQRSWAVFNHYEDRKEDQENEWASAKLVASSNAPKALEKLNASDISRREAEQTRRQGVRDRFYYTALKILKEDEEGPSLQETRISGGSSSPEDLEEEMRRWIIGEKDDHDIVVENYKKQVSYQFARQLQVQEEQLKEAQGVAREANEDESALALVGLTLSELRGRLQEEGFDPHTSTAHYQSKGREYLYRRYLEKAPSTGTLSVNEDGKIIANATPEEKAPPKDIDLSGRKVEFGEGVE